MREITQKASKGTPLRLKLEIKKIDKILLIALFSALIFSLYGIHWGRVESWNPDQMAFRSLFKEGELPLNPKNFHKPPFHTYFNFFLSEVPLRIVKKAMGLSSDFYYTARLLWSRLLTVFLFLCSVLFLYFISKRFFGSFSAHIISILFSTSAGLIAYSHFLTADIPVMFWMIVAFYFAQNILLKRKTADYALAGFFTGIATATKYNGLAIGISIVVAHILSLNEISWKTLKDAFLSKRLYLGLFMVIFGFLVANPFALLDYPTFVSDFVYNCIVTPVYGGNTSGVSYLTFFLRFAELIGYPSLVVLVTAFLTCLFHIVSAKEDRSTRNGLLLALSVFFLYYVTFGSSPRLPTRFVLPILPFFFILSGTFWGALKSRRAMTIALVSIMVGYNLVCSFFVGKRFTEDPRMLAQEWVKEHIKADSSIESTRYAHIWSRLPRLHLDARKMPKFYARRALFLKLFHDDDYLTDLVRKYEQDHEYAVAWYSPEQLMTRNPDYVAINSIYYHEFFSGVKADLYPSIRKFFKDLLGKKYPYQIVFDKDSKSYPRWIYPQTIRFLDNRLVIFSKNDNNHDKT